MKPSPQMLILDALLELFERQLAPEPGAPTADLLSAGEQLHHINGLYIRLVESALEAGPRREAPGGEKRP